MNDAGRARTGSKLNALRVLIVEDESIVSFLIEDMLTEMGCEVIGHAVGVREALTLLAERRPDAAVLDVNLRGEMAFPVAERLEAERIPFLFATGYGQAGLPERWRQRPVIQKPFGYSDLSRALEAAVSKTDR